MASASNAESRSASRGRSEFRSDESASGSGGESSSPTLFDRLATVGRVIWAAFLAFVVVFALIPVVALWFGAVPFPAPPTRPYFALVGGVLVGTVALIAAGIYDV
ncbi:hypothetical protein [Halorussus sp. MSC15.2]|uniref:hypothetical protein n=1 Tax=Halorussus sp. MSC15.2 TaxID=2283638 RepID=UPI0013D85C22|nr:hypothetical protein [Halorussus sp. MSC15.2]NEU56038.1 hypothetical protein [Halorussus sp. MSC15.2]